ncbi:hypothetical protein [Legionella maioricensis]|uniref:Uncharacterized protein n=1 Tax=Legionella maioricensis TaxID=2896528 RepID=A0A9X2IAN3_9GAMM|nr:hypothetical protein [Legionella maioricensis]MCL9683750.1 hypothetical protein [Legionella maioricensis]
MSFKEWIEITYGIKEVVEGKITDLKFVPNTNPPPGGELRTLRPEDGRIYDSMRKKLNVQPGKEIQGFICPGWMKLDSSIYPKTYEYKEPAPIYFRLSNRNKFSQFTKKYNLHPAEKREPLSFEWAYLAKPVCLEHLYTEYKAELKKEQDNKMTLEQLEEWEKKVAALLGVINRNPQLETYVNKAHHLSKDYSNDDDINNAVYEACSGYSVSLQIYAELNKELLSKKEYASLQHAIDILGRGVEQGLKTDANFMHYLVRILGKRNKVIINPAAPYMGMKDAPPEQKDWVLWNGKWSANPIKQRGIYPSLEEKIDENINNLLNGNPKVDWWGGAAGKPPYKMRRFLPDANMMSETNEITLQGGRMINHSAMLRIIKVGVKVNGGISNDPKEIHHFDYYHVQTNLGAECNELNGGTCTGTYITKLGPTRLVNDQIVPLAITPETDPKGYQQAMETTIRELIKAERHLLFYRKPQEGPNGEGASPVGSPEAEEWTRVNNRLTLLKGSPIGKNHELNYFSIGLDGKPVRAVMKNQKNYAQGGGSCTIFSIKQLVTSILEMHATSLHSNFLQHHDGKSQVAALSSLQEEIKQRKIALQAKPKPVDVPKPVVPEPIVDQLTYDEYYDGQMQFFDRYIRKVCTAQDDARLQRIAYLQKQQRICFLDEFLEVEPGKELETTRIGYTPFDSGLYTSDQLTLAPDAGLIDERNRRLTRYRLVYGPVDFYLDNQLKKPTEIPVITACAPNMMGTSKVDIDEFSEAGLLKTTQYENECRKLADFIVFQAKTNGNQRLIMPTFGVGVYINQLNPYSMSPDVAKRIMYLAFAEAAKKHSINVDWIIWKNPVNLSGSAAAVQQYQSFAPNNKYMNTTLHTDMISYAQERQQQGEKVVLLNPGSDRTVGGAYTHKNPKTGEEQIAQKSDLILLQSELNPAMVKRFNVDFKQRKAEFIPKVESSLFVKLNIKTPVVSLQNGKDYRLCFENINAADQFCSLLALNGIEAHKVAPSKDNVVILSQAQWRQIPKLSTQEELISRSKLKDTFKMVSAHVINTQLDMQTSPLIVQKNNLYSIGFFSKGKADQFSTLLASYSIKDVSGNAKFVQQYKDRHVVYLTIEEWNKLPELGKKYENLKNQDNLKKQEEQRKLEEQKRLAEEEKRRQEDEQRQVKEQFKQVALHIHQQLELSIDAPLPFITKTSQGDYKISFVKEESAKKFSEFLAGHKIFGSGGKAKFVDTKGGYSAVVLKDQQWLQLPALKKQDGLNQQDDQLKIEEEKRRQEEQKRLAEVEKHRQEEQKHLVEVEKRRQEEQKRLAEVEKRRQEEQKRLAEVEKCRQEEQKHLVEEEKRRQEEQKRLAEVEKHRQEEQKRLAEVEKRRQEDEQRQVNEQFKQVARHIHQQLELSIDAPPPFITKTSQGDYKISFVKEESAKKFSEFLAGHKIFGSGSKAKFVDNKGGYSVVVLKDQQWLQLPTLKRQSAPTPEEIRRQEKLTLSLLEIDEALNHLRSKIGTIEQHNFSEAKDAAVTLLNNLTLARNGYEQAIKKPGAVDVVVARQNFNEYCERAIIDAKEVLIRDLDWGNYLINLLKTLANAVIWTVSLGNVNSFFTKEKPASLEAVEEVEQDLRFRSNDI